MKYHPLMDLVNKQKFNMAKLKEIIDEILILSSFD